MKQGIPETIKLFKFASKGLVFSQTYKVSDFPRISKLSGNPDSPVTVEVNFSLEEGRIPCIKGGVKLDLDLTCQRCLNEVKIHLEPKFELAFIKNEQQGEGLGSNLEMILNTEEEFSTIEFITDEVLISVPMTPMHEHECVSYQDTQPITEQKRENPFAILKQLKTKE
ncbi:MAG: Large ribosomal RNA subunit accumulation protein YceD [Catillopecten margaritatus gill symbiont]|uniref:Large ribosomal RNA subunit accumulation protein YceD n=1 Tax=Catillopecten margaritatus gill symbiont TaxID=3083288 RepID=A0AAU6PFS9_9GAMM